MRKPQHKNKRKGILSVDSYDEMITVDFIYPFPRDKNQCQDDCEEMAIEILDGYLEKHIQKYLPGFTLRRCSLEINDESPRIVEFLVECELILPDMEKLFSK